MKYLFESTDEQRRIPITKLTWDKIAPVSNSGDPDWKWQKDTVDLPDSFMTSSRIQGEIQFERWFSRFVKEWGTEGELVETRPTYWKLQGNHKWDVAAEQGSDDVTSFYSGKKSGDYVED